MTFVTYGEIAAKYAKSDRGVAATALVHMAECYQKMGDAESRKIYEHVVRDFADQKEAVAVAHARLGVETGVGARRMSLASGSRYGRRLRVQDGWWGPGSGLRVQGRCVQPKRPGLAATWPCRPTQ